MLPIYLQTQSVSAPEIKRLRKRFMKLDRDGSGTIDKDDFLQIPAIANNPLALRLIAIFDEEYVSHVRPICAELNADRGGFCGSPVVAAQWTSKSSWRV